jgi:transposase
MLYGILWILCTNAPRRDLPERFGSWRTLDDHFARWREAGVYDRILAALHIRLDADGKIAIPQPVGRPRKRPSMLAGDRGDSCHRVRDWLRRCGMTPLIPRKDNELLRYDGRAMFDKQAYRRRSIVEQTICWQKQSRRIGTRFEKPAINFLAMMKLAMITRCLPSRSPTEPSRRRHGR